MNEKYKDELSKQYYSEIEPHKRKYRAQIFADKWETRAEAFERFIREKKLTAEDLKDYEIIISGGKD